MRKFKVGDILKSTDGTLIYLIKSIDNFQYTIFILYSNDRYSDYYKPEKEFTLSYGAISEDILVEEDSIK